LSVIIAIKLLKNSNNVYFITLLILRHSEPAGKFCLLSRCASLDKSMCVVSVKKIKIKTLTGQIF